MPIHYWVAFRPSQENSLKIEQPRALLSSLSHRSELFRKPNPVFLRPRFPGRLVSVLRLISRSARRSCRGQNRLCRDSHELHEI